MQTVHTAMSPIYYNDSTILRMIEDVDAKPRIMNVIDFGSRFKTTKAKETSTPEGQLEVAMELALGWKNNGPWPNAKFTIHKCTSKTDEVQVGNV